MTASSSAVGGSDRTAVTVLQHLPHEGPGLLADVLANRGARVVRLWEEPCPTDPAGVGSLVVLGGDMCTDERAAYPHLADEVDLLAGCVEAGTPGRSIRA
jgi:hypothetical protein